jgi:hypothetical protein
MKVISKIIFLLILTLSSFSIILAGEPGSNAVAPERIQNVGLIKLSNDELRKIGVQAITGQITYTETKVDKNEDGHNKNNFRKIVISGDLIDGRNYKPKPGEGLPVAYPRLVVNVFPAGTAVYYSRPDDLAGAKEAGKDEKTKEIAINNYAKANNLVCIFIDFETIRLKKGENNKVYLWYEPTPEFVSLLPKEYRDKLNSELNPKDQGKVEDRTYTSPVDPTGDLIKSSSIYPNPSEGNVACLKYELNAERIVTIALYDISGNKILNAISNQSDKQGEHQVNIPLEKAAQGMYIVMLVTDRGEKAVQRLIVANR